MGRATPPCVPAEEALVSVKLLIVDNSLHPEVYTPVQHWTRFTGVQGTVLRPEDPIPEDLATFTHAFVSGSEASICADDPWIERQCEVVRRLAAGRVRTLASCFGHQMLAKALWGRSFVRRSPTPEFGWVEVELTQAGRSDPVLSGVDPVFHTYSAHFDEIAPLPPDFVVLGRSQRCPHAVVRVADLPMWGLQHHPEISIQQGAALLDALRMMMPERLETIEDATQPTQKDSLQVIPMVRNFLSLE